MNEYELLYDSEDFSVLLPNYLGDSVFDSSEVGEIESENGEDFEYSEDSGDINTFTIDDVYANQLALITQVDNLNSNVCIMNDNLIKVNNNLLFLIGVSALALFFTFVNFAIRIFNNTLGLGKV